MGVGGEIVVRQRSGSETDPGSAAANRSDLVQRERGRVRRRAAPVWIRRARDERDAAL